jgi:secreted trypsin-like serine protease
MRRPILVVLLGLLLLLASPGTAGAITFGQPDGNRHPQVGAVLYDWDDASPGPDVACTGTLIAPRVFLTASHCFDADGQRVMVSFASDYDEDAVRPGGLISGTAQTHPLFGSGGASDTHDIAVIQLDRAATGITPATLPAGGLLDRLQAQHVLDDKTFTAVGYGTVRDDKTGGPQSFEDPEGIRRFALQSALSLQEAWLTLSMNPSTGDGGTCYGDSGGPHFLGGVRSTQLVSITITGDAMCRATDKTYRLDSASARAFLDDFVTLP